MMEGMFKIISPLEHAGEGILQAEHHLLSNPSFAKGKLKNQVLLSLSVT